MMTVSPRLSAVIITKNEANNIADCLHSLAFADERIVLDCGSTDDTCAIAKQLGASVHINADWQGFGVQKNRALALAQGRWVLVIDADERVDAALAQEILDVVNSGDSEVAAKTAINNRSENHISAYSIYEIPRLTQFCGQWIHHCGWTPDFVLRLFLRGSTRFSDDLVHERLLTTSNKLGRLRTPLRHYSYKTPSDYWRKLQSYSQAWAEQRYTQGVKTSMTRAAIAAFVAFVRSYFLRLGFLDGSMGFAVCVMQSQATFGKYFALYCLHRQNEKIDS